ncbi:neuropeptide FF receptor 2-like [Hydractinia symbiolongicarpus]|uniref:neuropeptide FF receptor 2-like n=1 Tax=Hydractinia symbiolongicarpus TaxID=13093 RepID=UPI0025518FCE|nr:neuropeptide FF receptor 2-like [Hydractinia symbiolongicarpus]
MDCNETMTLLPLTENEEKYGQIARLNQTTGNTTSLNYDTEESFTFEKVSLSFVLITSVFGNIFLLAVLIKIRSVRLLVDKLILSMTVCNLLLVIIWLPVDLYLYINGLFPFGLFGCKAFPTIATYSYTAAIFTLVAIAFERRHAVLNPFEANMNKKKEYVMWIFIHGSAIIFASPSLHTSYDVESKLCYETWDITYRHTYTVLLFLMQYLSPVLIMTVCYFQAWKKINASKAIFSAQETVGRNGSKAGQFCLPERNIALFRQRLRQSRDLLKMFTAVVVVFIISAFPIHVIWLIRDFNKYRFSPILISITNITKYANCIVNPWIYGRLNKNFRKDFQILFWLVLGRKYGERLATRQQFRTQ